MTVQRWIHGLIAAACVFALGCSSDNTAPSDPAGALSVALSPPDQALADQINADIQCTFNGGQEKAMLKRFRDAVNKKERNQTAPLQEMIGSQINDIFDKWEQQRHIQEPTDPPCGTTDSAEVVARLIVRLATFAGLDTLDETQLADALDSGASLKTFRLEDGGGDVVNGCVGYFLPGQTTNEGWVTILLEDPAEDPGFSEFEDTAPHWVRITSTFGNFPVEEFDPKIEIAWFLIDELVPDGEMRNCTIRQNDGNQLVCDDDEEDLETTDGALGGGFGLQCQTEMVRLNGWRGRVWDVVGPVASLFEVDPLWANPGNTGLRSSFASPFGSVFDEEVPEID